jgi:hypothetical protein
VAKQRLARGSCTERFGFELVGVFRSIGWKTGARRDVGWWQVELSPATGGQPVEPGPPVRLHVAGEGA